MEDQKIKRHKQIAAIIGIILLAALYLVTFILALCRFDGASSLFMGALACTVVVPILIWIYIWLYGLLTRKKTIATLFPDAPHDHEVLEAQLAKAQSLQTGDTQNEDISQRTSDSGAVVKPKNDTADEVHGKRRT